VLGFGVQTRPDKKITTQEEHSVHHSPCYVVIY